MTTRVFTSGWKRAAVTVAVAYALAVQALLLSFGGALHAGAAQALAAIVCAQGSETGADHQKPAGSHEALCCTLSCHGAAPAGPAPALASFERLKPVDVAVEMSGGAPVVRLASGVLPLGSRAPPPFG